MTVHALYEASADPDGWMRALGLIEEITGSAGAIINLVGKSPGTPTRLIAGERMADSYDEAVIDEYNRLMAPLCPRVKAGILAPHLPYLCDYAILDEHRMSRDPVYDWYTGHGVRYFIGSALFETPEYNVMWSLQRSNAQQHVQAPDIDMFLRLKPHIQKAVHFANEFETLRSSEALGEAVLESLPHGVLVLDSSGNIVATNRRGEMFLCDEDGVRSRMGRLLLHHDADQAAFEALFATCRASAGPGAMQVSRPSGKLPYILSVMPVSARERFLVPAASVLVTLQNPSTREIRKIETLVQLFGFTRAEAALAGALASGHSLASVAHLHGISQSTARVHLKSVFRKARVNRQADLVRLISSLSPFSPPLGTNDE